MIAIPTVYEDPEKARLAVAPYVRALGVAAAIVDVRDEQDGDAPRCR